MGDFIKVHIGPHPANNTIITFQDGEQLKFGDKNKEEEEENEETRNKAKLEIYMRNHYKGKKYAANVAIHAGEIFFNDLNFKDKVNHWREYMYNEME